MPRSSTATSGRGWAERPVVAGHSTLARRPDQPDDSAMETSALTTVLGDTWFGASLPVATMARLAGVGRLVEIPEGTVILREGRPCAAMGILVRGRIALRLGEGGSAERTI